MTGWRIDLTVLTDLSASMFAACFMILLIFLSLVQAGSPPVTSQVIDASRDLHLVHRSVLAPDEMVELLRNHGTARDGVSVDVFADRVEISSASDGQVLAPAAISGGLLRAVSGREPARLYVFSNELYNDVIAALGGSVPVEMTVPRALRDPLAPLTAWSPAFLGLQAQALDPAAFRNGLAVLLDAATNSEPVPAGSSAGGASAGRPAAVLDEPSLLSRVQQWLAAFFANLFPGIGLFAVLWIERRRLRIAG